MRNKVQISSARPNGMFWVTLVLAGWLSYTLESIWPFVAFLGLMAFCGLIALVLIRCSEQS